MMLDSTKPRSALVVGMGISGRSVSELLLRQGVAVTATDLRPAEAFNGQLKPLEALGCRFRLGSHEPRDFLETDQIVVSPGVPLTLPALQEASARGVEVIGELEWAWRQVSLPTIAVTGTNGKTTTTSLLGEVLRAAGKRVFVGGNIGTPLSRWVLAGEPADVLVLEVSSFQLDTAPSFAPDVGVLLNITEDHLDRYPNFSAYADSKFSLFTGQKSDQVAILNGDDPLCRSRSQKLPGRTLLYSRTDQLAAAHLNGRTLVADLPQGRTLRLSLEHAGLTGLHNEENILAATLAAGSVGVEAQILQTVIDRYKGLPHRVEWVGCWKGIDFFDDSKGTNVGAVVKAIEGFERPILLLMGGRDKLGSYAPIVRAMGPHGKAAFAFGESAERITGALNPSVSTSAHADLEAAFGAALGQARAGDVVLLSPACSSFDQYTGYAQRGDHFKQLVQQLTGAA